MRHRIVSLVFTAISISLPCHAVAQDFSEPSNYGEIELSSGFEDDPHTVTLSAGGFVDLSSSTIVDNCVGWVSEAPDYQLTFRPDLSSALSLGFYTDSEVDTVILINDPQGNWHCNDDFNADSELGLGAGLRFEEPLDGIYDVWVGVYNEDDRFESADLLITELNTLVDAFLEGDEIDSIGNGTPSSSGTGFAVSRTGHIVTNHHVVADCQSIAFRLLGMPEYSAEIIASNVQFDLALLKVDYATDPASFPVNDSLRLGDEIVVYGFPLIGDLSSQGNLTNGVVSALTGLEDDLATFQMNAQIQPGNSGGPVINRSGSIVGVVSSTANDDYFIRRSGNTPQNINFAIKASILRSFLDANNIDYEASQQTGLLSIADIAEAAQSYTGTVSCQNPDQASSRSETSTNSDQLQELLGVEGDTIEEVVAAMNSVLPILVDDETRFDEVTYLNGTVDYSYTLVNFDEDDIRASDLVTIMRPSLRSSVCEDEDMAIFRDNQIPVSYTYKYRDLQFLANITIYPSDC